MITLKKLAVAATFLTAGVLTFGAPATMAAETNEIKIGWQPAAFFEFFLAREEKLFEKAGLKPTFVKFISGPAMFAAIKSGDVDVTFGGTPPFVYAMAQKLDVSLFYWSFYGNLALVVRPDSGITQVKDLEGKKIATVMGSSAHYALIGLLADAKVSASKVDILNMQVTSLIPAFSKGDVPAAMIWEPWGVKLTQVGGKRVGRVGGFDKFSQTAIYWGRRTWMNEHPETMNKFLGAIDEAITIVHKDPARAAKALGDQTGIEPKESLEILNLGINTYVKDMSETLQGHPLSLKPASGQAFSGHVESLYEMASFLHKNGNITVNLTREEMDAAHNPQFLVNYLSRRKR